MFNEGHEGVPLRFGFDVCMVAEVKITKTDVISFVVLIHFEYVRFLDLLAFGPKNFLTG